MQKERSGTCTVLDRFLLSLVDLIPSYCMKLGALRVLVGQCIDRLERKGKMNRMEKYVIERRN